ncbi:hypothetical protein PUNSTDRAFT_54178 [Punctularia strigosozonata HHB-11173 SS5]|uniref:uncharacterized protein n=1 Tax=Punctularia strigosozonata (strain HHB-11173) TaxID=741275 RepID=UPI000441853B|nr:uncharacterized protein PUNSTDRAFT_54178 [Punctularia strigosozonata HHB-11173 SS5]EIN06810.1 hypothetical protein PUNSTDRAFT_54178 [Punctularia strigosozonata HHB-11173 SS5]
MTPLLFEAARLLSIVPAIFGSLWNVYHAWDLPDDPRLWRVDYLVAVLWCVLTGWQCLRLTTGLLTRWRVYYTPLSTLIRLLALQAICWPATNFTLTAFGYEKRPVVCWAIVGTTTCCSRAIQMWVTSNLVSSSSAHRRPPLPPRRSSNSAVPLHAHAHASNSYSGPSSLGSPPPYSASTPALPTMYPSAPSSAAPSHSTTARRQEGWLDGVLDALVGADVMDDVDMLPSPRRGGRRWDWRAVGIRCALPAGAVYFVMAWAEAIRREWAGC